MKSLGSITEDFNEVLNSVKKSVMRDLRVGTFARVISVNTSKKTVDVQPIVEEKINTRNGYEYLRLPQIKNIKYAYGCYPRVGDLAICVHFDRGVSGYDFTSSEELYLQSGTERHNINDCVAIIISNKDDWVYAGQFTSAGAEIADISDGRYTQMKVVKVYGGNVYPSEIFELSSGSTFCSVNVNNVTITKSSGKLKVGSVSGSGYTIRVYLR